VAVVYRYTVLSGSEKPRLLRNEHALFAELAKHQYRALERVVFPILLDADIESKRTPPHFAPMDERHKGLLVNSLFEFVPRVEVLWHMQFCSIIACARKSRYLE
jgi:hypothetical protein